MNDSYDLTRYQTTTIPSSTATFFSNLNDSITNFISQNFMNFDHDAVMVVCDEINSLYQIDIKNLEVSEDNALNYFTNICTYISNKQQEITDKRNKIRSSLDEMSQEAGPCLEASIEMGNLLLRVDKIINFLSYIQPYFNSWQERVQSKLQTETSPDCTQLLLKRQPNFRK